jgi:hypothetical protein
MATPEEINADMLAFWNGKAAAHNSENGPWRTVPLVTAPSAFGCITD